MNKAFKKINKKSHNGELEHSLLLRIQMNLNMFRNLHYVCKQLKSVRSLYEGNSLFKNMFIRFGVNGASKLNIPAFGLFLRDHAWFIFHLEHLPRIYLSLSIMAHKSLTVICGIILLQCSRNWISTGYSD